MCVTVCLHDKENKIKTEHLPGSAVNVSLCIMYQVQCQCTEGIQGRRSMAANIHGPSLEAVHVKMQIFLCELTDHRANSSNGRRWAQPTLMCILPTQSQVKKPFCCCCSASGKITLKIPYPFLISDWVASIQIWPTELLLGTQLYVALSSYSTTMCHSDIHLHFFFCSINPTGNLQHMSLYDRWHEHR